MNILPCPPKPRVRSARFSPSSQLGDQCTKPYRFFRALLGAHNSKVTRAHSAHSAWLPCFLGSTPQKQRPYRCNSSFHSAVRASSIYGSVGLNYISKMSHITHTEDSIGPSTHLIGRKSHKKVRSGASEPLTNLHWHCEHILFAPGTAASDAYFLSLIRSLIVKQAASLASQYSWIVPILRRVWDKANWAIILE